MARRERVHVLFGIRLFEIALRQWQCAPLTTLRSLDLLLARVTLKLASRGRWVLQKRRTRQSSPFKAVSRRSSFKFLYAHTTIPTIKLSPSMDECYHQIVLPIWMSSEIASEKRISSKQRNSH